MEGRKYGPLDFNKMSKNYECQIAYFSKLRVQGTHKPMANKYIVKILELRMPMVIDCSKITGADSYFFSKNYMCQIAYFPKLLVQGTHEPMANKAPVTVNIVSA